MAEKMSKTNVKIIVNVGCRDDTVPKTIETRRHCVEDREHARISLPTSWFWGLRKILACSRSSSQCFLVSTVFGVCLCVTMLAKAWLGSTLRKRYLQHCYRLFSVLSS